MPRLQAPFAISRSDTAARSLLLAAFAALAGFTSGCGGPGGPTGGGGAAEEGLDVARLERALSSLTTIVALHSGHCVDVQNVSLSDHALLQQYPCHGGGNQLFVVDEVVGRSGQFTIANSLSKRCLDIPDVSLSPGVQVQQYSCLPQDNQRVEFLPAGLGYRIRMVHSGLCVTVPGGALSPAVLEQAACGAAGQIFGLTVPPPPPPPDFTLQASAPAPRITWGEAATSQITVTPRNGFSAAVALSQSGGPPGTTFSPASIVAPQASTLALPSRREAQALGARRVTVGGSGGGLQRSATLTYRVGRAAGTFRSFGGVQWGNQQCGTITGTIAGSGLGATVTFRDTATNRTSTAYPLSAGFRFSPGCRAAIVLPPASWGKVAQVVNLGAFGQGFGTWMTIPLPFHYWFSLDDSLLVTDPPVQGVAGQQTANLHDVARLSANIGAGGAFTGTLSSVELQARPSQTTDQAVITVQISNGGSTRYLFDVN